MKKRIPIQLLALVFGAALFAAPGDVPLNLSGAVNRGFRSEPDNPALPPGWTNDGPRNDLRKLEPGDREFAGVRFRVIDPAKNSGKSVLAVAGLAPRGVMETTVPVNRAIGKALYLLHAASWIGDTSRIVGKFIITYADGNVEGYDINRNADISDWWDPIDKENARCVWTARNPSADIGIFVSGFPIEDKPIRSITFQAQSNVGWMILGATGSQVPAAKLTPPAKFILKADRNWTPIAYPAATAPGSVLDFSFLLDAPAGKHGRLAVRDGHFEFTGRPGERVRFYGTNLCESTGFLDHALADRQVAELAATGYNSVRLHHYENDLLKPDAKHSLDYDPARFDLLDYQLAKLKERGIYITLDAFCSREPRPGEIPGLEPLGKLNFHNYKQLFPIHRGALENLKEHIRILLTHRNPYTGMTYGEDPSFITLSLVNENEIFGASQLHAGIAGLYREAFENELGDVQPATELERSRRFTQFLAGRQRAMIAELTEFIRKELKSDILITDNNAQYSMLHNFIGERLEFVDSHIYFDHPWFPEVAWRLPEQLDNVSAVEQFAKAPREIFGQRILGKPFTITEFNYCFPNSFRAESGPMMGGYSAFQDFDAIYRFDYLYNRGRHPEPGHVGGLSSGNDPACYFADKIGLLLFLRGDVRPGEKLYTLLYGENFMAELGKPLRMTTAREWDTTGRIPDNFTRLGLKSRVASLNHTEYPRFRDAITEAFAFHRLPDATFRNWDSAKEHEFKLSEKTDRIYRSDTGELELNAEEVLFKVDTPRSAALCMARSESAVAGPLRVSGPAAQRTVAVAALGDAPLRSARRLLVFHLTTVYNTGTTFGDKTMRRLEAIGELPMLVRNDRIKIELELDAPEALEVLALSYDGTPRELLPATVAAGKLVFTADSAAGGGSFVYLIREKQVQP